MWNASHPEPCQRETFIKNKVKQTVDKISSHTPTSATNHNSASQQAHGPQNLPKLQVTEPALILILFNHRI